MVDGRTQNAMAAVADHGTFDVTGPLERTKRCVLCSSPIEESLPESKLYRKCRNCDVSWYCLENVDQSSDQKGFGDWDQDYYADDRTFNLHVSRRSGMRAIVARLGRLLPQRGRLLDVGTGLGVLLEAAGADGWQIEGVEPSARAAAWARDHSGAVIHEGFLEAIDFPEASFQVITMVDVLRTIPDPLSFLANARRLLRPGGYLMVRESYRQIAVRSRWSKSKPASTQSSQALKRSFDFQGFSPRSLVFALQRTGFQQPWVEPSPIFADRSTDSLWRLALKGLGQFATKGVYFASARSLVLSPSVLAFGQRAPR